tara:strand:+ start:135 stop:1205 length:1071 start_codon:yes stop_codon:yes gene_type:complete
MLELSRRIFAFETLGRFLSQFNEERKDEDLQKLNKYFLEEYRQTITQSGIYNNWFSKDNVEFALQQWSEALSKENLEQWVNNYSEDHFNNDGSKRVAVIMAGNLPLVGFHDFLSVLLSGHKILIKPSSEDMKLLPFIAQILVAIEKSFAFYIEFAEGKIENFDGVIATGSDNSSRYFEYYFSKYPNIIRKNRTSIAVLNSKETEEEMHLLGEDVFRYFGLGCRNVSKIYFPKGFNKDRIFEAFFPYKEVIDNNKYANNYDYNRAIFLLEKHDFYENGFVILKESENLHAPGAVVYFEEYESISSLKKRLDPLKEQLQCVVANENIIGESVKFGESQKPKLWDYADHLDTIKFLRTV